MRKMAMRTARSWQAVLAPRMTWWKRSSGREKTTGLWLNTPEKSFFGGGDEDLVVGRTTHLRHMLVKMGSSSPNIRGEHKKSVSNHQRVQMVLKGRKGFRPFLGLPWHPNSLHIGAVDHQVENPIALKP